MVHTSKTGKHPPLCAGFPLSTSLLHGWLKTICCCWRTELLLLQFPYFNFWRSVTKSISSAAQCVTLHNKIGWRKVQIFWFGSRKWFWLCIIEQFAKASKSWTNCCAPAEKSYKYDLTAAQGFWLDHHNNWSRWFAIGSSPPICCPSFSFMGGVEKKKLKLGCEKHFCSITYWALLEMPRCSKSISKGAQYVVLHCKIG